jgi:hypothetical protein
VSGRYPAIGCKTGTGDLWRLEDARLAGIADGGDVARMIPPPVGGFRKTHLDSSLPRHSGGLLEGVDLGGVADGD